MKRHFRLDTARGFSLVEVMVALIIIAVGMLGIAKIQALAFSSTGVASARSLAAIEASSLAAAMSANRGYWAAGFAPVTPILVTGTTISDANLAIAADCTTAGALPCAPATMAAYDMQQWAIALNALLPNDQAIVTCAALPGAPISCTIQISWTDNLLAANNEGSTGPIVAPTSYTLYVEP
jgi:type IV pilus assembly protein PilV